MLTNMTASAWAVGSRNALVLGAALIAVLSLAAGAISFAFDQPFDVSFWYGVWVVCAAAMVVFFVTWWWGWRVAGRLILDCGPHPARRLLLVNAGIFFVLAVTGSFARFGAVGLPLGLLGSLFFLVLALGRLQVREHGLWAYWGLTRWAKFPDHEWTADGTLVARRKRWSLLSGALPVPPEHREALEALLREHRQ